MRDSIRSSLLGREEKESSVLEEAEGLCSLTLKQVKKKNFHQSIFFFF